MCANYGRKISDLHSRNGGFIRAVVCRMSERSGCSAATFPTIVSPPRTLNEPTNRAPRGEPRPAGRFSPEKMSKFTGNNARWWRYAITPPSDHLVWCMDPWRNLRFVSDFAVFHNKKTPGEKRGRKIWLTKDQRRAETTKNIHQDNELKKDKDLNLR